MNKDEGGCKGVANGKFETARLAFFSASQRLFDFLDCETEIEIAKLIKFD